MIKKITLFSLAFLCLSQIYSQNITGKWYGYLDQFKLRIVFNISETKDGYKTSLDSPDQSSFGIPASKTIIKENKLEIEISVIGAQFKGQFEKDKITGTFSQVGTHIPLVLTRKEIKKQKSKRPQTPKKPYPYYEEEVVFLNKKANITLAGTLTLPKKEGKFPAVILISGSGPQNRNEEILDHKPFLILSDYLTKKGIAVLRYDDRGFGASTGNHSLANSADFASDAESAFTFLKTRKEIVPTKIGLIGHSEGGLIAPMVAAKSKELGFIVLLAGVGTKGDKLLLAQQELIARASGISEKDIENSKAINSSIFDLAQQFDNQDSLKINIRKQLEIAISDGKITPPDGNSEQFINRTTKQITSPWMLYFLKCNPKESLNKVSCPVLAVNGAKDLQVPPKENLNAIKQALNDGGNKNITTTEYPNLNHLFQECVTGLPSEYGLIEQTFSPKVMLDITEWILKETK
ncbi:alpha/beta hydrolase [uncultured Maribacter sp.]|uniref:alpha/beta hydrolase family protein n=1 Tax=uncultured Maribacter sp. TaxID=431308 RepID=UPI0026082FA6|nr:alpha/beta hydrolase [uncultured Maribacter sp.]